MFKLFLNIVIVFFFVEVAYVNFIKRIYDDDMMTNETNFQQFQRLPKAILFGC